MRGVVEEEEVHVDEVEPEVGQVEGVIPEEVLPLYHLMLGDYQVHLWSRPLHPRSLPGSSGRRRSC